MSNFPSIFHQAPPPVSPPGPNPPCNLVSFSPPPPSSVPAMTFPAPSLLVHTPGCWAGRAQPHPGCALTGAPRPGSQTRVEEGLLGKVKESESEVALLFPTLCQPMDCSPPGSSVHGIFQARILEWVAISFSRRSSQPRD